MYHYRAKLDRVVDGDTVDLVVDLGFNIHHKVRVRLYGIDTPEIRTRDPIEKMAGLAARDFVSDWFAGHNYVYVKTYKEDKYGRILGELFVSEDESFSLNEMLIDAGLASKY